MPTIDREEAIFAAVLEIADPEPSARPTSTRPAATTTRCAGRSRPCSAAHDDAGSFLGRPPRRDRPPPSTHRPSRKGPARSSARTSCCSRSAKAAWASSTWPSSSEPVRRKVALKIIKPGMDSRQVIARFEAERQALAMMDHQNIARVLDAGTTDSGRPYFVMELVHGVPITEYCDDNQLTPRERLELFVPVCQAIQHAHQKGIIHRDIKPSNVLVTMYDDKPVPKVIDFGVAKAIEQRLTEKTLFTQFGALVGTFEYMSPEQAEMNAFGVDTRSDIYSLGVLLYELLTGTTPLERQRLREAALDEMVRLIREEEPPRPSMRLSSSERPAEDRGRAQDRAGQAVEAGARRARLDRDEVPGEGPDAALRDGQRPGPRRGALPGGRAGGGVSAEFGLSAAQVCPQVQEGTRDGGGVRGPVGRRRGAEHVAGGVGHVGRDGEANRQRIASEVAKQEAVEAKAEADKQRDEARLTAYASGMGLAQRAWEENNVVRARELLEEVPKEAAGRDLRGFEWYYLSRLCHSEVLTLKGHAGWV